jgi:energy-coupling factor transport system ATP-binding protein
VGSLFQNPAAQAVASTVEDEILFGLENLGLPRSEVGTRLEEALARFGLEPLRRRAPHTLSGGETQRLMLASVLACQPGALVLDEPLSMLDSSAATELVAHLHRLAAEGRVVVACEHRSDYFLPAADIQEYVLASAAPPAAGAAADCPLSPGQGETIALSGVGLGHGDAPLFEGLDLQLRTGEVTAIVAANGVGKTTLLRAMAGIHPCAGRIVTESGRPPELGLMFQNADWQLFCPTVRDEILYRVEDPDPQLYDWLVRALSLSAYEAVPPLLLSEGEKKRLALALLLMRQPRHGVLLDEPTLGQDDAHRAILGRTIRALAAAGRVVVTATHDLLWAACYADRLVLLAPGEVVADGPTARILQQEAAWQRAGLVLPDWVRAEALA